MHHGFIKVASATPKIIVGNCEYNGRQILNCIKSAAANKVKILVLPELCITGYTAGDLFYQDTLLDASKNVLSKIAQNSPRDMLIVLGLPIQYDSKIYNVAATICNGKVIGLIPKIYLPNYNEFYEKRQFASGLNVNTSISLFGYEIPFSSKILYRSVEIPELVVSSEICEDLWFAIPPSCDLALAGATIIANLSASNELIGKAEYRRSLVVGQSARIISGYIYACSGDGESTSDVVFAGHNMIAENGKLLCETELFSNVNMISTEIDVRAIVSE
ncbi:MAG: NAD(+) synthase, partial [Christensenellaceae bacterium]|nr:NAD(+) synthase [Christensenellaceae bacterium]